MKTTNVAFGLKANWKQFTLLVVVNAFVGGMIGLERAIIPKIAEADGCKNRHPFIYCCFWNN